MPLFIHLCAQFRTIGKKEWNISQINNSAVEKKIPTKQVCTNGGGTELKRYIIEKLNNPDQHTMLSEQIPFNNYRPGSR